MKKFTKKSKTCGQHIKKSKFVSAQYPSQGALGTLINNPGLHHVAEEIFWNLNFKALENCQQINQSSNEILKNPLFWMKKLVRRGGISKENEEEWMKALKLAKNSNKEEHVVLYLKWKLKNKKVVDLPCFTNPTVQDDFKEQIWKSCRCKPNISSSTLKKHFEIIKILAPLTENSNAPNEQGQTPIHWAAYQGYTEIVKILAPLTDNPNAPDKDGYTPIQYAAFFGHTEIFKILEPLTDNPNAPNKNGCNPIYLAAKEGHTEIVKLLAPSIGHFNDLIKIAKNEEIRRILESFKNSAKRKTAPRSTARPSKKRAKK